MLATFQSLVGSGVYCDATKPKPPRFAGILVFQSLVGSGVYCDATSLGCALVKISVSIPSREWSLLRQSLSMPYSRALGFNP